MEAKQIRSEVQREHQPHTSTTLPISQIQSLIRAGADPARVAERYALSEALVRRFSAAVETEKQYAIEQFLAVPAPKESRVRTLSELIERTFAAARVRLEDVTWKATRRGLEPWKITAQFTSNGRTIRAEWTWNMHDNAVTCLNATAKKLIGEQDTPKTGGAEDHTVDEDFLASLNLPGNSARSARIEQTVSAWNTPEPTMPAARPKSAAPSVPLSPIDSGTIATTPPIPEGVGAVPMPQSPSESDMQAQPRQDSPQTKGETSSHTASTPDEHGQGATKAKRRAGRSAVPSWDEILFGD